ncbi:probable G-protein coupled receptor 141 [Girardinichthys multiradiatus]|uniref:probable G-protein coupled receptor 141 n=1 Tax=Girardinichthys multiradiatus TaxID=208333 RepID=UPI001FABFB21|nr:probable G-protein coupled receptor 141 [Girardinichthys multiradiatus]XP_047204935.1 probable G-protein coupled receptor 141 [Girardinichthys multiradiatus]
MNTTVTTQQLSTSMMATNSTSSPSKPTPNFHTTLLVIYIVVFLCGIISLSLMMHIMKSSSASATSIAVFNLIFAHFIFLLTVPFRLYYYATNEWKLGPEWCKMVSAMIHIHMYMSLLLYVIILITRLWPHYCRTRQVESFGRMHALIGSVVIWVIVLILIPCITFPFYGQENSGNSTHCFKFAESIDSAKPLNYILSILVIVVAVVLTALQAKVLWGLYNKDRQGCTSQQDFGAQLKSLCFALIMLVCFVPYHIFRLYYIERTKLENINEVLLSLTTFNCLDMLTFLGRRTFHICFRGRTV